MKNENVFTLGATTQAMLMKMIKTKTCLIFWSKLKSMKQTCWQNIKNWQCYITIDELQKLASTHMGGGCCKSCVSYIINTSHTYAKPFTSFLNAMFRSLSTSKTFKLVVATTWTFSFSQWCWFKLIGKFNSIIRCSTIQREDEASTT